MSNTKGDGDPSQCPKRGSPRYVWMIWDGGRDEWLCGGKTWTNRAAARKERTQQVLRHEDYATNEQRRKDRDEPYIQELITAPDYTIHRYRLVADGDYHE